ncbi:CHU large protein [Thioploca ingrica]|uniref:CHU large protein n=1 Tax=Thioploca ingrica TaxID=40754 RepID=A0A090AFI4_9GAMM|nr:CHU large protein [Thioploca ingrica]
MNIPIRLISGLFFSLFIPIGLAAPPNDNLNTALTIKTLPYTHQQDTVDASNEANEVAPRCSTEAKNSVWYQYAPTSNQDIVFNTLGSSYDTVLSVWQGKTHPLTPISCNDENSSTPQSQVRVHLEKDTTYYLNVSGYTGDSGTLILNAELVNKLTNNNRDKAIKIVPNTDLFYSHTQATEGASIEAGEAVASCAQREISGTVWYEYTPHTQQPTQRVVFNTIGSDYNTVLSVWANNNNSLTEIACNDDNAMPQSQLAVELEPKKTYYINVATAQSSIASNPTGLLIFNMTPTPANDDKANAISITEPFPYNQVQYTGGATLETGELVPTCSPEATASVWYLFTPSIPYDDGVTFSTAGSGYDTVLSIWQAQGSSLVELGCNDNSMATEQSNTSQVTVPVTKDVNYYVDISGANGEMGNLIFQVNKSLGRDFNIAQQPQNQSISSNQTATLTVELNNLEGQHIVEGGTPGEQWGAFVALPINYQWYQGQSGDTSTPVGTSYIFTTSPLTTTTPYWVRISNPTGSVDSEMAKVIVDGIDTLPPTTNGIGIDPQYSNISTTANFTGQITSLTTGLSGNDMKIRQPEIISVNSVVDVDPNHMGQDAEIVIVGVYTNSVAQNAYMRNGDNWEIWDWNIANLAAAEPAKTLADKIDITVFNGSLAGMPGHFTGYVGYRLQNGNIFYSGKPMTLVVE